MKPLSLLQQLARKLALAAATILVSAASPAMAEGVALGRAHARIEHCRLREGHGPAFVANDKGEQIPNPELYLEDGSPNPEHYELLSTDETWNVKTTVGIDFLFTQGYSTSTGANGLNYIGLSNDAVTETSASTTLSNEIAANGLTRAIGAYAHTTGTATATISKTFTASGAQSAQKAALFNLSSAGTMTHVLGFTQRALISGDTLSITYTITIS